MTNYLPIRDITEARQRLHAELRATTSTRNAKGSNALVAHHIADDLTRNSLFACTSKAPCRLPVCQGCERRAAARYLTRVLPIIDALPDPEDLRYVTLNLFETTSLAEGDALMPSAYRRFRSIIANLRANAPELRIWGNRETEPKINPATGEVTYLWHLHFLVHLAGCNEPKFVAALRQQWSAPRAVCVRDLKQKTLRQQQRSVIVTTLYGRKVRWTYLRSDSKREWLPPNVLTDLAKWMLHRPRNWARFTMTSRAPVPSRGIQTKTNDRHYTVTTDGHDTILLRPTRRWQKRFETKIWTTPKTVVIELTSARQSKTRHAPTGRPGGGQGQCLFDHDGGLQPAVVDMSPQST